MIGTVRTTQVSGIKFNVWSDFDKRGTFALNIETGEIKQIQGSGYIKQDLTVRKAIARAYQLPSFRK